MLIKAITLNILRGEFLDAAVNFLKQENPDIILLQEVYDGKDPSLPNDYRGFDYLKEQFAAYHAVYAAQLSDITSYGNIDEGNAIYSKYPILSSKSSFFDITYNTFNMRAKTNFDDIPQSVFHAEINIGHKKIRTTRFARNLPFSHKKVNVFNVHGIWGFDGRDNPRRLKMSEAIIKEFKGKENVILAGDFNLNPDTQAARNIEQHLTSVFGQTLKTTFNMKHKENPSFATAVVDMMFVSSNIKVVRRDCPNVDVSDHLPLVAELEV